MKEQWIIEMQQKLAGYRQPAPEVSWDEIEKALAKNRQKAKAKMIQMWTRRIVAAVVVLVAVLWLTGNEATAGLSALGALLPYYAVLYLLRNRHREQFAFDIE